MTVSRNENKVTDRKAEKETESGDSRTRRDRNIPHMGKEIKRKLKVLEFNT